MSQTTYKICEHSKFSSHASVAANEWRRVGSGAITQQHSRGRLLLLKQDNVSDYTWFLTASSEPKGADFKLPTMEENRNFLLSVLLNRKLGRWGATAVKPIPVSPPTTAEYFEIHKDRFPDNTGLLEDRQSSPAELLKRLQGSSISQAELFETVLFAEVTAFNETQTKALLPALFDFVSSYRLSHNKDTQTAVGAAIRKLAMNLPDSQIEQYVEFFLPTETDTLPCEIELELAKAIVWRLAIEPVSLTGDFPILEICLAELASDYLKPRLILQKNYASIALQAILGTFLLNSQHADQMMEQIIALDISWFSSLLERRLEKLISQLGSIEDAAATTAATELKRFVVQLQSISS